MTLTTLQAARTTGVVQRLIGVRWILIVACAVSSCAGPTEPPSEWVHSTIALPGTPIGIDALPSGTAYVVQFDARHLARVDIATEAVLASFPLQDAPITVTVRPDEARAYVGVNGPPGVVVIDLSSGAEIGAANLTTGVNNVVLSRDANFLYVTNTENLFFVLDATSFKSIDSIEIDPLPIGIAEHPTLQQVYVTSRDSSQVHGLSRTPVTILWSTRVGGSPHHLAVSPDGNWLYVANRLSGVNLIDLKHFERQNSIRLDGDGIDVALSNEGQLLWVTTYLAGGVAVIDTRAREIASTFEVGGTPIRIAVYNDGEAVLVTNERGWIDVFKPGPGD